MHIDLVDLRLFFAVAQAENITRGAERCHLSASSASVRIKSLEEELGTSLLVRSARGVTPTPAGHVLKEHAQRFIAQLEQMHVDLSPFAKGIGGTVNCFANNNAISSHLPDDLARFFALHPRLRVTLEERMSHDVVAAVSSGRADLGVVAVGTRHPQLEYRRYKRDRLVLLVPLDSRWKATKSVPFSECLREPFISLQHGAALHTFLMLQANMLGGRLDVRVQVSGYRAIARLVESGAGIGIVPKSSLEEKDRKRLAVLELDEPWAVRDLQVCFQEAKARSGSPTAKLIDVLCGAPRT